LEKLGPENQGFLRFTGIFGEGNPIGIRFQLRPNLAAQFNTHNIRIFEEFDLLLLGISLNIFSCDLAVW